MVKNVMMEGVYQNEEVCFIRWILEEELIDSLHDIDGGLEEVDPITLISDYIMEENEELKDEDEDGEELKEEDEELDSTNSYDNLEKSNDNQINYLDFD